MTSTEIQYRGFTIKPKHDFGTGYHIMGEVIREGYVVTQFGANVMPGAAWFLTVVDAKKAIANWIEAEERPTIWWLLEGQSGGTLERKISGGDVHVSVRNQRTQARGPHVLYKNTTLTPQEALELAAALTLAARNILQGGKL